jgi:hypothetical protein
MVRGHAAAGGYAVRFGLRHTGSRYGWLAADFSRMLARRKPRPDRGRASSRRRGRPAGHRKDISLGERTLWRMLYENASRSAEVLALNVGDLDLPTGAPR